MNVRMSTLVELDGGYDADHVHEARVELKVVVGRTDVIGGAQDALHDETDAHGVEEAKVLRHSVAAHEMRILFAQISVRIGALLDNKKDIADVAEDVVESGEGSRFDHAEKVEVARILIARLGQLLVSQIEKQ